MHLDGFDGKAKVLCDLGVAHAARHMRENLQLLGG